MKNKWLNVGLGQVSSLWGYFSLSQGGKVGYDGTHPFPQVNNGTQDPGCQEETLGRWVWAERKVPVRETLPTPTSLGSTSHSVKAGEGPGL